MPSDWDSVTDQRSGLAHYSGAALMLIDANADDFESIMEEQNLVSGDEAFPRAVLTGGLELNVNFSDLTLGGSLGEFVGATRANVTPRAFSGQIAVTGGAINDGGGFPAITAAANGTLTSGQTVIRADGVVLDGTMHDTIIGGPVGNSLMINSVGGTLFIVDEGARAETFSADLYSSGENGLMLSGEQTTR